MSKEEKRLLLVEPEAHVLAIATAAGLDTWSVTGLADGRLDEEQLYRRRVRADFQDADRLFTKLVKTAVTHEIPHILYFGDEEAIRLAVERALLELSPTRAEPLRRLRGPEFMRRILNQAGVSVVRAKSVPNVAAVRTLAEEFTAPVVVKAGIEPRTTVLRDGDDLDAWAADAPAGPYVVEEFLTGPRISVDTLTREGMHQVTGMTVRADSGAGLLYPAPLSEADRTAIRTAVRALLDLAGLQYGPAHTEVVVTERGPRIAASAARPAPSAIRRLMHAATGWPPEEDVLSALTGSSPRCPAPTSFAALTRLSVPCTGPHLAAALDDICGLSHVHDARVAAASDGTSEHVEVIVRGGSPRAAQERLTDVRRRWATNPHVSGNAVGGRW
ncbi:acetyl-CoA carboxylase biotin carboxylase subunit family protein [Streptomyces sp. cg2]|uniref:ATP-grasp domain-containing protein n=1 Tax=Streptomyces sp. cg2 TaxID=3238799 RepID=UPI0034E2C717